MSEDELGDTKHTLETEISRQTFTNFNYGLGYQITERASANFISSEPITSPDNVDVSLSIRFES